MAERSRAELWREGKTRLLVAPSCRDAIQVGPAPVLAGFTLRNITINNTGAAYAFLPNNGNVVLTPRAAAPSSPVEGMLAYADGTTWNPGGGAGFYGYTSGAWVKL